jgi:tetratricopeptide (TPR) repeat protein
VAFAPDGRQALSAGHDKTIRAWDVQTGEEVRQFLGHTGDIIQALYSPDGRSILSAADDGTVRLWDVATGAEIRRFLETGTAFPPLANPVAFTPDGRRVLVAYGGGFGLWDVETGQEIRRVPHLDGFDAVAVTPDGKRALTSDFPGGRLRLWDIEAGTELRSFYPAKGLHPRRVQVSPDGRFAACGNWRGSVSIWRLGAAPLAGEDVAEARQGYEKQLRDHGPPRAETLRALDEWAALLADDGAFAEAEKLFAQGLDSKRRALGADHADTLAAMKLLAGVLQAQNRPADAEPLLRECRDGARRAGGAEHPDALVASNLLADVLEAQGKRDEVEVLLRECSEGWRRLLGPGHTESRAALAKLAASVQAHGKLVEAEPLLLQLLEVQLRTLGPQVSETGMTMDHLIKLLGALGSAGLVEEAENGYRKAAELMPDNAVFYNHLAWLLATCPEPKFRNPSRAVELAKRAVELAPEDPMDWNTLGVAHYRAGNWKEAIANLEKAEALAPGKYLAFNAFFLAMAHWQLGEKDTARQLYAQAVAWMEKNKPSAPELREELGRFGAEAADLLGIKDGQRRDQDK